MKLGIIIPTFQEEKNIYNMVKGLTDFLNIRNIDYEVIVIDDNSSDLTSVLINKLSKNNNKIKFYLNDKKKGFGNSVVMGIDKSSSEIITIMMADKSDSLIDLEKYYNIILENNEIDCVFGDRWSKGSIKNYPIVKKIFNRFGNKLISILFKIDYCDFTNSFKMYRKTSLLKIYPILSNHFSITIELPLKLITRGFKFIIMENSWENREHGISKMKLTNSIITYSIIIIYCLIDKFFWNKRYESKI